MRRDYIHLLNLGGRPLSRRWACAKEGQEVSDSDLANPRRYICQMAGTSYEQLIVWPIYRSKTVTIPASANNCACYDDLLVRSNSLRANYPQRLCWQHFFFWFSKKMPTFAFRMAIQHHLRQTDLQHLEESCAAHDSMHILPISNQFLPK